MAFTNPASWLGNVTNVSTAIGSIVPNQYESYARVFNPVRATETAASRWCELASRQGLALTATTRWDAIRDSRLPSEAGDEPLEGDIDRHLAREIIAVLSRHTGVALWWSASWIGYAENHALAGKYPSTTLPPDREMILRPMSPATTFGDGERFPVRFWPDDHAWFVGGDIYSRSVVVGGTRECIDGLLSRARIEAVSITEDRTPSVEDL